MVRGWNLVLLTILCFFGPMRSACIRSNSNCERSNRAGVCQFFNRLEESVKSSNDSQVRSYFLRKNWSNYLFQMVGRMGGLNKFQVAILPVPPGWNNCGRYWIIFYAFQEIEQDHDPVYELHFRRNKWKIGEEIPEDNLAGWRIKHATLDSKISPSSHSVSVTAKLGLEKGTIERAPLFRLNCTYKLHSDQFSVINFDNSPLISPPPGSLVRAGSLVIPWTSRPDTAYTFQYSGVLKHTEQDVVNDHEAYLTAWWVPSLGRLPYTVNSTIIGPKLWKIRAEGTLVQSSSLGNEQKVTYKCPLAISYPKIIAGDYTLVASKTIQGQTFHIWQLHPINTKVAKRDLKNMIQAAQFYEKVLGPLPFHGYACYDSDEYYGIESYSHTLLNKTITHFISHEMGHSYFGGIVPCTYVHDSWNEGVTEFIDSVVLLKDKDKSLEHAFDSINTHVPLTQMPVAWSFNNASYYRGCYVMKMLEETIGDKQVLKGLRDIVRERVGIPTRWDDLRHYFEKRAGYSLKWFWRQWIDGCVFPRLVVSRKRTYKDGKGYRTYITVLQVGEKRPFRLLFNLVLSSGSNVVKREVTLNSISRTYKISTTYSPGKVSIDPFPLTLAHVK